MTNNSPLLNAFTIIILLSVLANLILGGLVLADSPQRKINRLFACLCAILSLWAVSFVGFNLPLGPSSHLIFSKLYSASILFIPPIFFHLVLGSIGHPVRFQRNVYSHIPNLIKQIGYVFSSGWLLLTLIGVFPVQERVLGTISFPVVGPQYWVASFLYLIFTGLSIAVLSVESKQAKDPTQKNRLMYMQAGASIILLGGVFNLILTQAVDWSVGWLVSWGHLITTVCMLCIAYALTTSRMYHFTEMLRKTIAFLFMTMILLVAFGGTHTISSRVFLPYLPNSDLFALGAASIIMALIFHPLRYRVQNLVDRFFFTQRYDQLQRLRGLSRRVLSSADRDELLNVLFSSLQDIGFGSISLMLKDPQKPLFHTKKAVGLSPNAEGFFLKSDSLLIQYLREEKDSLVRDEVTRRILADWERQALSDEMDILQSEIAFPLFSTRRRALFGVITLGKSDLGYSSYKGRNIFWLKSVIDNAGIMLDNFYHQEFANALVPYVGRAWADEMRRNKEGFRERLAGHRTWVSILMVDIRHFTNMSARMDPQEVVSLLKDFRLGLAPVVYRHQGTIDKFIGDAVMIVFGLPILPTLVNPDKNAVECALSIKKEVEEMNKRRFEMGEKEPISIGIGVSSGEVIAGNVDSGDRVEYTVIGDAANMVARLEDLAGDDQILLAPATYSRVKEFISVNPWTPRRITGFSESVPIYELLGYAKSQAEGNNLPSTTSENKLAANQ